MISASKYHSYGNDFLIVYGDQMEEQDYSVFSKSICRPHFGVGADGCIFVAGPKEGVFDARIFNCDGSEAGMSGNGCRCACAFLHHKRKATEPEIKLHTISGAKAYKLIKSGAFSWEYRSYMGEPSFLPSAIPFQCEEQVNKIEDYPLQVCDEVVHITALSVGNPQCVVFVDQLPQPFYFEKLGPGLEKHRCFPARTNVSFVKVEGPDRLRIQIWERGVGQTQASGTGACGAAVAAIRKGKVQSPVLVFTESGAQEVAWEPGGEIVLTGGAEFVADVEYHWSARA